MIFSSSQNVIEHKYTEFSYHLDFNSQFYLVYLECSSSVGALLLHVSLVFRFLLLASTRSHEFEEKSRPQRAQVNGQ